MKRALALDKGVQPVFQRLLRARLERGAPRHSQRATLGRRGRQAVRRVYEHGGRRSPPVHRDSTEGFPTPDFEQGRANRWGVSYHTLFHSTGCSVSTLTADSRAPWGEGG